MTAYGNDILEHNFVGAPSNDSVWYVWLPSSNRNTYCGSN